MKLNSSLFLSSAQWLLVGFIALIPFIFVPIPWLALAQVKMGLIAAVALLAALLWTVATAMKGRLLVPQSILIAVGAALPLAYLGSALFSGAPYSLVGSGAESDTVAAMALWFVLMAAVATIFTSGKQLARIFRVLLVSAFIVEAVQLLLLLGGGFLSSLSFLTLPAASIVGSWQDLGIFLGLSVLLSLASLETEFAWKKWLPWATLALAFILLVIINIRDIWIAVSLLALASTIFAWFIGWRRQTQEGDAQDVPHRFTFGVSIAIFLISFVFIFIGGFVSSLLPAGTQVIQAETRPSWQGTVAVASSVYRGGGFLFGTGPNTFDRQWGLYKPEGVNETAFWNADFVQGVGFIPTAFVTVGILGAIAWIAFLVLLTFTAARTVLSEVLADRAWRFPAFALSLGAIYLFAMLFVYAPGPALVSLAFVMAGVLVALGSVLGVTPSFSWEFSRSRYGFAFILVPTLVVIGVGAAGVGVARALIADSLVNHGITVYNATGDATRAQESVSRALTIYPGYDRALRGSVELNLIRFNQLAQLPDANTAVRAQLQDALQRAISNGLSAVSADTNNYQNWLTLATAYQQLAGVQVEGAYENAKKAYEQALAANPSNPTPYLQMARLAALQGDMVATREYLNEAINRKKNFADAYYLLSQLDVAEGRMNEALEAAGLAVQSAPGEPLLWFQLGTVAYLLERYEDSALAFEQAVALNANYANALYLLGFAYDKLDRGEEALFAFERVAILNPDNPSVAGLVAALQAGEPLPAPLTQ